MDGEYFYSRDERRQARLDLQNNSNTVDYSNAAVDSSTS